MDEDNYTKMIAFAYSNSLQALALSETLEEFIPDDSMKKQFQVLYKKRLAELVEEQTSELSLPHDEAFLQVLAQCKS